MATDRYSDDHKIVVGGGNSLTIESETLTINSTTINTSTTNYDINADSNIGINSQNLNINTSAEVNISSDDDISISSNTDIILSSDSVNIDSTYLDLKTAEVKSFSSPKFHFTPIKFASVSNSVFIPAVSFVPFVSSGNNLQWSTSSGYIGAVANGEALCPMPFIIPDGSTITSINMLCYIDDIYQEVTVYLYRNSATTLTSSNNVMATLTSNPGILGAVQSPVDNSISYDEISYDNNSYYLRLSMNYGGGVNMRFFGVKIFYSTNNIAA